MMMMMMMMMVMFQDRLGTASRDSLKEIEGSRGAAGAAAALNHSFLEAHRCIAPA
jgi:hypothetical protein